MASSAPAAEIIVCSASEDGLAPLLTPFLSRSTGPTEMQNTVRQITDIIVSRVITLDPSLLEAAILVPILRAALPMYVVAQNRLTNAGCALVRCKKAKGSKRVCVEWLGERPTTAMPAENTNGQESGQVILLDTVVATGDTITRLCDEFKANHGGARSITVLTCYASPAGIDAVARHEMVKRVVVGFQADSVDEEGFLVPYTNGDVGDKMFGKSDVKRQGNAIWSKDEGRFWLRSRGA